MKIRIAKSTQKQIGNVRVSNEVYEKLDKISAKEKVSKQEVVRAILDEVINKVEF